MSPTTNQLITALLAGDGTITHNGWWNDSISNPLDFAAYQLRLEVHAAAEAGTTIFSEYIDLLANRKQYTLNVEIKPASESELLHYWQMLQVPIEPITNPLDRLMALTWIAHHNTNIVLKQHKDSMTLLGQALNAGVPFDVQLCFELAGLPSRRDWETWRAPDGTECPTTATVNSRPTLGNCRVHFHNGEYALVSGEHWQIDDIVRVESLVSTAIPQLAGLIATNSKPKKTKQPELNDKQIKELANKYI